MDVKRLRDFAYGTLMLDDSHSAICSFSKVRHLSILSHRDQVVLQLINLGEDMEHHFDSIPGLVREQVEWLKTWVLPIVLRTVADLIGNSLLLSVWKILAMRTAYKHIEVTMLGPVR